MSPVAIIVTGFFILVRSGFCKAEAEAKIINRTNPIEGRDLIYYLNPCSHFVEKLALIVCLYLSRRGIGFEP